MEEQCTETYFNRFLRYFCCISNTNNNFDYKKMIDIFEKDYTQIYNNIKLDINYDIIEKIDDKKYLVDK